MAHGRGRAAAVLLRGGPLRGRTASRHRRRRSRGFERRGARGWNGLVRRHGAGGRQDRDDPDLGRLLGDARPPRLDRRRPRSIGGRGRSGGDDRPQRNARGLGSVRAPGHSRHRRRAGLRGPARSAAGPSGSRSEPRASRRRGIGRRPQPHPCSEPRREPGSHSARGAATCASAPERAGNAGVLSGSACPEPAPRAPRSRAGSRRRRDHRQRARPCRERSGLRGWVRPRERGWRPGRAAEGALSRGGPPESHGSDGHAASAPHHPSARSPRSREGRAARRVPASPGEQDGSPGSGRSEGGRAPRSRRRPPDGPRPALHPASRRAARATRCRARRLGPAVVVAARRDRSGSRRRGVARPPPPPPPSTEPPCPGGRRARTYHFRRCAST